MLDLTEKLQIAMLKLKINQSELAKRSEQSKANLSNKMQRNDYKMSEYAKLVQALGCQLVVKIVLPNGEEL